MAQYPLSTLLYLQREEAEKDPEFLAEQDRLIQERIERSNAMPDNIEKERVQQLLASLNGDVLKPLQAAIDAASSEPYESAGFEAVVSSVKTLIEDVQAWAEDL